MAEVEFVIRKRFPSRPAASRQRSWTTHCFR